MRSPKLFRTRLEALEDRTVPAAGEWLLRLEGLPDTTIEEQMEAAEQLIEDAHIEDVDIEVVDHAVLDGNIVIEAPPATPLAVLTDRLSVLPGFVDVQPFEDEEEEEAGDPEPAPDGSGPLTLDSGPASDAPGTNLNVGLVGNEPTIAVNPLNPNNVVVAQFNNGAQTLKISLNGGASFPVQRNGVLVSGQTFFQGDDSLAFDAQGRLFWSYLSGGSPAGPNVTVVQINPATGAVIGAPSLVATSNLDKEWLAADRNPASPFANNLYVVWHDFNQLNAPVRFARSTNQGATWTTLGGNLSGANEGFTWPSEVTVAPNGDVWVAWHTNTGATNGEVRMRRSTDGGVTFGPEIIPFPAGTGATTTNSASGLANKITGLHVWLQGSMQPRILVDPVRPGNVYVVSVDDPDTFTPTNDPSDVVIARSTDNGLTWTRSTISQGAYGDSEIMPAAAIDAAGNIAVTWYSNRRHQTVADSLGGTHDLLDLYATTSLNGGLTFSTPTQVNDPTNPFDPERGAPDRFSPNHVLRIGEYNGLSLVNGTGYAVWTGNTGTGQQIQFDKFSLGYRVIASTPAAGQVVTTAPTDFVIQLNSPVNPATVQASDLTVNGVPADSFGLNGAGDTVTFHYNSTPVAAQGLQAMAVAAGALASAGGAPVEAFSSTFRYDALPLAVTSTNPPFPNGTFTLPGPLTYDVNFNEPFQPGSLQATDLTLSGIAGATVTGVTALNGNTTARFTIGGAAVEGTLTAGIAAGALTDAFGNPGVAFSADYQVDYGTVPYPTPLSPKDPRGSLIYDPSASGLINFPGDTDGFTINVEAGQTITVLADPVGSPDPVLYGAAGNGAGAAAGQLLLINPTTGASTVVGDPVTPGGLTGLVYDPSANVFLGSTVNGGVSTLVRINPDTGALISTVGTVTDGPGGPTMSIGDLAIQPGTNALFGVTSNVGGGGGRLFTIDKATGVATFVGATRSGAGGGLAFAPDGGLYQTAFNSGFDFVSLNKIDPATAGRISTVPLQNYFDGLAIRPDGTFFAALGGTDASIYTINPNTGAATLVGNTTSSTSDLAFRPSTALAPTVELRGPANALLASASAGAGLNAVLQTVPAATGGTYTVTVGGAAGTTGGYTLRLVLNAALEAEGTVAGASNDTRATAQDLGPSFLSLRTPQATADRGAVSGHYQGGNDFFAFTLAAGQSASLALAAANAGTSTALFGARADFTGFDGPISVAYGDLNGDGWQDMVAANYNSGTVSVLPGDGAGGFGPAATYSLAAVNPWTVALGDLNGDGKRDIVTSNIGSGTVSVLLGDGAGGFGPASVYAVGTSPYGVAVGDLNGDGRDDVVTANYNTNDLTVRLGQADGTLGAAASYPVSVSAFFGPVAVGLGDFNGDGKLDAVSANYNGNNVTLLLGDGAGGLGSPAPFGVGANPFSLALGDLNGDGRTDVVTGNNGGTDVSVRFGDGAGGFGPLANYASGGTPIRVAVGDVDGDGRLDIAVSNLGTNTVGVLRNTGGGAFGTAQTFAAGADPYGVALPDLNGDGLPDLSSANYSGNTVSVWMNATLRVQLQLQDASGVVLATGAPAANLTAAIGNFVAPAAGTYYVRVFGAGSADYDLVVTRDAAFDTEANDTFATAQSLGRARGVLGSIGGAGSGTLTLNATDSGWWDSTGFHSSANKNYVVGQNTPSQLARDYFVFDLSGVTQTITGAQLRLLNPAGGYVSPDPSETYAVYDVSTPLTALGASGSGQVSIYNDLGTGVNFGSQTASAADNGQLVSVPLNDAGVAALDAARGGSTALGGALTTIAGTATQFVFAFTGAASDVKQLVLNLGVPEDWYSIDVASTASALRLETSTPGDGPGEFVNALNPHIELYRPDGTLVAAGVALGDGRNEFIQYTPLVAGTYRVRVISEGGTSGEYFLSKNFGPAPTATVSSPIDENGAAVVSGTVGDPDPLDSHTVVITWGPGEGSTTLTLGPGVTTFTASHQYLDDDPTATASDSYPIGVTVTDGGGAAGTAGTAVTVNNVAPVLAGVGNSASTIGAAAEGQAVTVSASFTDVGTRDAHAAQIDWGDGVTTAATVVEAGGSGTVAASHAYAAGGVYAITVRLTDDDTGGAAATTRAYVSGVGLHDGVLQIVGTAAADEVHINAQGNGGLKVHGSFLPDRGGQRDFAQADVRAVLAFLGAGDDVFTEADNITLPTAVDGGAGNDQITTSRGRNILIGGTGADVLTGSKGQDILIDGTTDFDGDSFALAALLAEWADPTKSLAVRVADLTDGSGSATRANGSYFLTNATVHRDTSADRLAGKQEADWLFFDPLLDRTDANAGDLFGGQ